MKIQRLMTPLTLQRKTTRITNKNKRIIKTMLEALECQKLLDSRLMEQRERRNEDLDKKRSILFAVSNMNIIRVMQYVKLMLLHFVI